MKTWTKGAIIGFLFILIWLSFGISMGIVAIFRAETLAGIIDALFMLPFVPMAILQQRFGITTISPILASILLWTFIGASIGHLIDIRKGGLTESN